MIQLNFIDNSCGRMSIYDILTDLPSSPGCHTFLTVLEQFYQLLKMWNTSIKATWPDNVIP